MNTPRFLLFGILAILTGTALGIDRNKAIPNLFADEAVYHAMTVSLAYDQNLEYQYDDLSHTFKDFSDGPRGIILKQREDGRIFFAKPFLYPLFSVPFYLLLGLNGFLFLNVLAWWGIVWILMEYWGGNTNALVFSVMALGFSAFTPYITWIHPEVITSFCLVLFVWLWEIANRHPPSPSIWRDPVIWMTASLSIGIAIKPPLILLACAPFTDWMVHRHWKKASRLILAGAGMLSIILISNLLLTGDLNPYSGNRKIFSDHYPLESPEADFNLSGDTWSTETAGIHFLPSVLMWNLLYFWIGRFSGLIWYFFPGCAFLCLSFFLPKNTVWKYLLPILGLLIILQLALIPTNYHGGGGALGNRYFVILYPLSLMIIRPPLQWKYLIFIGIPAAVFSGSFLAQSFSSSYQPGIHTQTGLYTHFPVEWTLVGSYPIYHPQFRRVTFHDIDAYFYFMDQNSSGKEDDGFWIYGNSSTEILIDSSQSVSRFSFAVMTPGDPVNVQLQCANIIQSKTILPHQMVTISLDSPNGRKLLDIYGRQRWIYHLWITTEGGTIPKFSELGDDHRFLGVRMIPLRPDSEYIRPADSANIPEPIEPL